MTSVKRYAKFIILEFDYKLKTKCHKFSGNLKSSMTVIIINERIDD